MQIRSLEAAGLLRPSSLPQLVPAQEPSACHLARVSEKNTMLWWIAHVCRTERDKQRPIVRPMDIAYAVRKYLGKSVDESTIKRFERVEAWPHTPMDALISAYADELATEPFELWAKALRLWRAHIVSDALSPGDAAAESKPLPEDDAKPAPARRARRRKAS